ncbi:MAG TPA: AMP-binding protein [Polyangiaceae bacterium]|nr:AMP-binding protein [Polyangiaceae bacterium]
MITTSSGPAFHGHTLAHALSHWAQHRPVDTAFRYLIDGEQKAVAKTFAQLERDALAVAAALVECTEPGDRALLLYPRGLDFIAAFLGCVYAGVVAVPACPPQRGRLDRALPRLQAIAADSGAGLVLTSRSKNAALVDALASCPSLARLPRIATDNLRSADDPMLFADHALASLDPRGVAFVQYTSGATRTPQGTTVTHTHLMQDAECIRSAFRHDDRFVGVAWLPIDHDRGSLCDLLQPLYLGRPCTLLAPLDFLKRPARWLQAISRYRATTSGAPDFAYALCARNVSDEDKKGLDLSSWQVAHVGAEPIRPATLERFAAAFGSCGFRREAFQPASGMIESPRRPTIASPARRAALGVPAAH